VTSGKTPWIFVWGAPAAHAKHIYNLLDRPAKYIYNLLVVTYDETKRAANLAKHGLDFADAEAIFDHPVVGMEDDRESYGEQRINVLGFLDGQIVCLTYSERGDMLRAISLRKATRNEVRHYVKTTTR